MKPLYYALVITSALIATAASSRGFATHFRQIQLADTSSRATDGAYRDGLYIGRLHRVQGRKEHVTWGRWNNDADRLSFIAGYEIGYSGRGAQ
jgi:hypothetical protein